MNWSKEDIKQWLATVEDPDSNKTLQELDAIQSIDIQENTISFKLRLPSHSPFFKSIKKACEKIIKSHTTEQISIHIEKMGEAAQTPPQDQDTEQTPLSKVKNILAVSSGKGGVGKSTVAVNLALSLAELGWKVGILDTDIYGPSVPKMLGIEEERPSVKKENGKDILIPVDVQGIKVLSIGFFVSKEDALIWRGAMATGAIKQFINDTDWGDLDYFIIDMPPGTGDIHLTIVQTIPLTAAVIVSTPDKVSIADTARGVNMFKAEKIDVPILGFVENMSWFTPAELPDHKYYIFGKEGVKKLAEESGVPLLAQIPLIQSIREGGDAGKPAVQNVKDSQVSQYFLDLAKNVAQKTEERNASLQPTRKVIIDRNS
ncbi:MAG: sodium:proton antiporter [Bacteroidia bacterium]|nr:MAG: sodium:proton antiporter [Bacteroidia bacterium]